MKQFDASFKHPPQPGLYKRPNSGGSKEKAVLASLCFTPHPQLIPFTYPKLCLYQFNHFTQAVSSMSGFTEVPGQQRSIYPW